MLSHKKTHDKTPKTSVDCSVCRKNLSRASDPRVHARIHETDVTLTVDCYVCDESFPSEGEMLQNCLYACMPVC
jgi:hypothetical protein